MLLLSAIAFLGASVLADDFDDSDKGTYTIFKWDDGMEVQRLYAPQLKIMVLRFHFQGERSCLDQYFTVTNLTCVFKLGSCIETNDTSHILQQIPSQKSHRKLLGKRIAWLVITYLNGYFEYDFRHENFYMPNLDARIISFAEKGCPDYVDPYELAIYQSNQMNKSLLLMSKEDFLKTIGKN